MLLGLAFSVGSVSAQAATKEAPAKEAAAAEGTAVYLVQMKADGWGVGKRVSSALKGIEGIKAMKLSGLLATIEMEDGKELSEAQLKPILGSQNVNLVSVEQTTIAAPKAVYLAEATGLGWSASCEKARVALVEIDGISSAYVGPKNIILHLDKETELSEDELGKALKDSKVAITTLKKSDDLTL